MSPVKILFFMTCLFVNEGFGSSYIDFDNVRKEGGFSSDKLSNVVSITPSGDKLSDSEKKDLLGSKHLKKLRSLDLTDQNIDDDFIKDFCSNPTFSQIINLDLSNNPITKKSIEYILDSDCIGSVRDLPQISGRHGVYASQLYVRVENVDLDKEFIGEVNTAKIYKKLFKINYSNSIPLFESEKDIKDKSTVGIKTLDLRCY